MKVKHKLSLRKLVFVFGSILVTYLLFVDCILIKLNRTNILLVDNLVTHNQNVVNEMCIEGREASPEDDAIAMKYYKSSLKYVEKQYGTCRQNVLKLVTVLDVVLQRLNNHDGYFIMDDATEDSGQRGIEGFHVKLDVKYFTQKYGSMDGIDCTFNRFDKIFDKDERFNKLVKILDVKKFKVENNYELFVVHDGFYFVKCLKNNQPIYYDLVLILPRNMTKLVEKRKRFIVKETELSVKERVDIDSNKRKSVRNPLAVDRKMNVLFIKIDSISKKHFKRCFPSTHKYLSEKMKNNVFYEGLNSVGENSYPNMIPLLTGIIVDSLTELNISSEVEDYRNKEDGYFDHFPFIWNDYERDGYVTMYQEDRPGICQFNYNKPGFRGRPTALYARPYWQEHYKKRDKSKCLNGQSTYASFFDMIKQFVNRMNLNVNKNTPYLSFNFHSDYTHEHFAVPLGMDEMLKDMLETFENKGYFDNTLLILFSDHGNRLHPLVTRSKFGSIEKYKPFLMMRFPTSLFNSKFGINAQNNRVKLVSMFDLYQTLRHFLAINKDTIYENEHNLNLNDVRHLRGISLFENIPIKRSCSDAIIPYMYCTCGIIKTLSVGEFERETSIKRSELTQILLNEVVSMTKLYRNICETYKFEELSNIKKRIDHQNTSVYILEFDLQPGDAKFQVAMYLKKHNLRIEYYIVGKIIRISRYYRQSHCIKNSYLKNFCFCYNQLIK